MIDYENGALGDPGLPESEPHERPWERITWPVKGVVINVIPPDSPRNGQGQLLCDVKLVDDGYTIFNVTVLSSAFHQDTNPGTPMARQTVAARARGIFDGESFSPKVGSIVLVQFIGPPSPNRDAVIIGFFPVSMQSLPHGQRRPEENLFPREAQAVTVFNEGGVNTHEEFRARLHPTESETPRWTRMQNGTALEIDNRGNLNIQTTINRETIKKERYSSFDYSRAEIKETPDPEGNAIISTRGARKGNIGLFTGKLKVTELKQQLIVIEDGEERTVPLTVRENVDERNEEGNIIVATTGAAIGDETHFIDGKQSNNVQKDQIHNIQGDEIHFNHSDQLHNIAGQETHNVQGDETHNVGGNDLHNAGGDCNLNVGGRLNLGASSAIEPAVLGISLLQWIITVVMTHVHYGVQSGQSVTGLPTITPPDMLSEVAFVSRTPGGGSSGGSAIPPTPGASQSGGVSVEESTQNSDIALSNIVINNSNLDTMARAIARFEGFFPGSRSQRNNNPGNLMYRRQAGAIGKDSDGFAIFGNLEDGFQALRNQLTLSASGTTTLYNPNMTLVQFFARYDPTGNPIGYADYVGKALGVSRDTTIGAILNG